MHRAIKTEEKNISQTHMEQMEGKKEQEEGRRGSGAQSDKRHLVETAGEHGLNEFLVGQCQLRLFLVKAKLIEGQSRRAEGGWRRGRRRKEGGFYCVPIHANLNLSFHAKKIFQRKTQLQCRKKNQMKKLGKQIARKTKTKTKMKNKFALHKFVAQNLTVNAKKGAHKR